MPNHPNRARHKLSRYNARLRTIDRLKTVEMIDPDSRRQYRRTVDGLERRVLRHDGEPMRDGSPWTELSASELSALIAARGDYHPILDPLGL